MSSLRDVQEDAVEEEDVSLNVKVLAPGEAEVEEELGQPLILYELLIDFVPSILILLSDVWQTLSLLLIVLAFPLLVAIFILALSVLDLLSFSVYLPVLFGTRLGRLQVKVKDKRLLDSDIQVQILVFVEFRVVLLLQQQKPLRQGGVEQGMVVKGYLLLDLHLLVWFKIQQRSRHGLNVCCRSVVALSELLVVLRVWQALKLRVVVSFSLHLNYNN